MIIAIDILFKGLNNLRNDVCLETFNVRVGKTMLDVPGRILETPGIIYKQVGDESRSFFSNSCFCDRMQKLFKEIKNRELKVL